jgi:hypothetical protein
MFILVPKEELLLALHKISSDKVKLTIDDYGNLTIESDPQSVIIYPEVRA